MGYHLRRMPKILSRREPRLARLRDAKAPGLVTEMWKPFLNQSNEKKV